ncbi:MAG TPA: polymer-forming cytoskeletal protein [Spirochaetia bacterium]|nr:polymer-forming cytoskeletal protein [Spirochaetia bacterium]
MQIDIEANSTIGEESFFEGSYAVRGSLRIDGRFEGQSLFVENLQVGPKGKVRTDIVATSVVVEGVVIGNIISSRRILLLSSARVLGDLKTPELIIQDGVVLEGRCTISHVQIENTPQYIETLYQGK